jgi:hypothetical protein
VSCGGAAAESAVGGFWHGPRREGKRARDEMCREGPERGSEGPERGSEDGSKAQAGEHVTEGARGQGNNRTWPRGGGGGGARAPWRIRAMASASETTSRTRMRPPHLRQRVMSMAKMRARSFAHAMRRGRGEELGEEAGESSGALPTARLRTAASSEATDSSSWHASSAPLVRTLLRNEARQAELKFPLHTGVIWETDSQEMSARLKRHCPCFFEGPPRGQW